VKAGPFLRFIVAALLEPHIHGSFPPTRTVSPRWEVVRVAGSGAAVALVVLGEKEKKASAKSTSMQPPTVNKMTRNMYFIRFCPLPSPLPSSRRRPLASAPAPEHSKGPSLITKSTNPMPLWRTHSRACRADTPVVARPRCAGKCRDEN
jgi:hypothetical protein